MAESAASLTAAADTAAVRTLAAADALDLTDEAARTASIALGAESAIAPATAADASAVRAVAAESTLDLTDEAVRTSRVIWTLAVESAISLGSALGLCTTLNVGLASPLDLADSCHAYRAAGARGRIGHQPGHGSVHYGRSSADGG